MTSSLENLSLAPGFGSARADRQAGEVRHGGWMLELERAMLELGAKKNSTKPADAEPARDRQPAGPEPLAAQFEKNTAGGQTHDFSSGPEAGTPEQAKPEQAKPAGALERQSDASLAGNLTQNMQVPGAMSAQAFVQSTPLSQGLASLAVSPPIASQVALSQIFSAAAEESPQTAQLNQAARNVARAPVSIGMGLTQEPQETASSAALQEQSADAQAGKSGESEALQDKQEYARRQLHLYRDGDGVQAWIRDADVGQAQAYSIARALNTQLNEEGVKLKALTLNGKKVSSLSLQDDAQAAADASAQFDQRLTAKGDM